MSEVSLNRFRQLRDRASVLLENVLGDLTPFVKSDGTFRRKPDSPSAEGDVNVTTTCSCLMALALTNSFQKFYSEYKGKIEKKPSVIFQTLVKAPWMSSGLTANNAFTTTLVLRAFGFLDGERIFGSQPGKAGSTKSEPVKTWELHLGIKDVLRLATRLREQKDPASEFLWLSLSDKTRDKVETIAAAPSTSKDRTGAYKSLTDALALDLRKVIQSGWIYEDTRFSKVSKETKKELGRKPTGYVLADVNHQLLVDQYPDEITKPSPRSLNEIATAMAQDPDNFSINEYPPSAAVLYWFVDGITRAEIKLPAEQWSGLCNWAARQFNHERSLVVAEHDAMMDPVAMGMCACLCSRLRIISDKALHGCTKDHLALLPSTVELERSIEELISKRTDSGIFPKYFPIFHYQDAGSNFCFTFELLEAVLCEFGTKDGKLFDNPQFIEGLEQAVGWCENNRLKYSDASGHYSGWNSGGYLDTLKKGQPESWATAVVHMFLWELRTVISQRIQQEILRKYKARPSKKRPNGASDATSTVSPALDRLLDVDVLLQGNVRSVVSLLRKQIIENYNSQDEAKLRRNPIKKPLSALLFGPPGTSKTEITRAVAADLNWPLVDLTPSDFVRGTLANIYLQAEEIFEDLMDLSGVVVFFDEMDALVQTREGEAHLDIASQFLTTTMLPKLTRLHDHGRVVFFMATNFQDRFDAAIKRAGRFDLLLCLGPPRLSEKLDRLHRVFLLDSKNAQTTRAGNAIKKFLKGKPHLQEQLELYTFGEFRAFLKTIGDDKNIGDGIENLGGSEFRQRLTADSQSVTLKLGDLSPLRKIGVKWKKLADLDKKTFTLKQIERKKLQPTPIIRYFCDRKESKEQH
jgi:hypothetical protein